jgi:hypothetical protein
MTSEEAVLAVVEALDDLQVPYMLVGSFSSSAYGIPRSSKDADFVIELGERPITALAARLGPQFRLDPQMTIETVTMTTRHIVRVPDVPFTVEFFRLSDDPHDQERFRRRQRQRLLAHEVVLPTPEDVVITKLRWSLQGRRSKDLDDVRDVIAVQGQHLDWDYVHRWCDLHGTRAFLDEVRRSIPPIG